MLSAIPTVAATMEITAAIRCIVFKNNAPAGGFLTEKRRRWGNFFSETSYKEASDGNC